jgi:hypothetical protein
MVEYRESGPPLSIGATGTILNPWYELPPRTTVVCLNEANPIKWQVELTPPCRVELVSHDLRLFFQNDQIVFAFTGDTCTSHYLINPIRDFLTYQTFINYNLVGSATNRLDESTFDEVDCVRFKVQRITRVETERKEGDRVVRGFYYVGEDEWLEVAVVSLTEYLRILNPSLYYAIAFYLIGCDNPRYFLVEFYKAVEVITNVFGGERALLTALQPYGVTRSEWKDFGKVCNDMRLAPLDIGRHAPMPGVPLYSVDLRNLLSEPRSREVLEAATAFCRQVIDAYMAFLIQQAA